MEFIIFVVYPLSFAVLYFIFSRKGYKRWHLLICLVPILNTFLLVFTIILLCFNYIKSHFIARNSMINLTNYERKLKAQGVYMIDIEGKKYKVSEKEIFFSNQNPYLNRKD